LFDAAPTILIIEHDEQTRHDVQFILKGIGYHVVSASRGLDGIDIARKIKPDLIIVAMDLPDLMGGELTTTLRTDQRFEDTPVLVLLSSDDPEQRDMAFAAGINGHMIKPINLEALPFNVEFYMSGGTDSIDDTERLKVARTRFLQDVVKRLEERIRELENKNETLERIDQMKDSFIQLTAHELRTPLTLITGYSRLLEDHPPLQDMKQTDDSIGMLIDGLIESITRMQGIIEEILTVSRIMTNEIELTLVPMNLAKIVNAVIGQYYDVMRERDLSLYFAEDEWPQSMRADGDLIQLTLSNLLSNAIKYTPDGGEIYLRAQTKGKLVRFSVRDTGIGISQEKREIIFERFHIGGEVETHTTSKTAFGGGGLGLGLAICKGIIEAHGGTIAVDSPGHDPNNLPGSEFIVILPVNANASQNAFSASSVDLGLKKLAKRQ
jgi:signal transduction histidine kinase